MALPYVSVPVPGAIVVAFVGLLLAAWALRALSDRRRDRRLGELVAVDAGRPATLRSERYRLSGRPDALRRLPDGRLVPVELKSRAAPPRAPAPSHVVQVRAYCLLVEEATGVPPPFGILRYADGEYRVRWDAAAKGELLSIRWDLARPYRGEATPSRAKCARCPWFSVCDARVT